MRNEQDARPLAGIEMVVLAGTAATESLGAAERLELPQHAVGPWTGATDEDGVATFTLPAGPVRIEITSPLPRTEGLAVTAGEATAHTVLLPLLHAGEVLVLDSDGLPVAGADIVTRRSSMNDDVDAAGGQRLGLPAGRYRLDYSDGATSWSADVTVGSAPIEFVLRKG